MTLRIFCLLKGERGPGGASGLDGDPVSILFWIT